ncbi:MAG TPA: PAS domain-containing protein, partial [Novosphingobium sp.]|nr:PAS domain-containing protein [Novosphingobium sp.]
MSTDPTPSSALPKTLPVMAVLGLVDPADGDWGRLRGLQYSSLARVSQVRVLAHAIAALGVARLSFGEVHFAILLGWIALLGASLWHGAKIDKTLADADRRRISRDEVNNQSISSILNALVWTVPIAGSVAVGDANGQLQLWAVTAMLMTAAAVLLPAVPLANLLFTAIVGGCALVSFMFGGNIEMALVSLVFSIVVALGSIENARSFLIARIAEAGMAEKNEVVSLLLREFEEGEADWLWQVDASRRVRSVSPRFAYALGIPSEEIDGKPFIQLIAGEAWDTGQFPSSLHDLAERLKRRESFSNLLVRVTINEQQRWWELSGTPKLDENGNFDGFRDPRDQERARVFDRAQRHDNRKHQRNQRHFDIA